MYLKKAFFVLFLLVIFIGTVHALTIVEEATLQADDGSVDDRFGDEVAISGNTLVVGAIGDDQLGAKSGSAYVFRQSGRAWTQIAKLTADDGEAFDGFGEVAISGDYIVVGSRLDDDLGSESGSAYVYQRIGGAWMQVTKLVASDGGAGDQFGQSVAMKGQFIVVGAWLNDEKGNDSGAAYVFQRAGHQWVEVAKLSADDGAAGDIFGFQVAISGNTIVVGAQGDDELGEQSGSVYVFHLQGQEWIQAAKLSAIDGDELDLFGSSVAIDGDVIVVGAYRDDDLGTDSGSIYVYNRSGCSGWEFVDKLAANDGESNDFFGFDVAIEGTTIVVGSILDDVLGPDSGSAYIFQRGSRGWTQAGKVTSGNSRPADNFGWSVSISGEIFIIGSPFGDGNIPDSGSVDVYQLLQ